MYIYLSFCGVMYSSLSIAPHDSLFSFSCVIPLPPSSTLFPYTTLFRSRCVPSRPLPSPAWVGRSHATRSEEYTSELQSRENLVCRLLLEKKKKIQIHVLTHHIYHINIHNHSCTERTTRLQKTQQRASTR